MGTTAIRSVQIGASVGGGADADSNHLPDDSGVTYVSTATTDAIVDSFGSGDELSHEEAHGRREPGQDVLAPIGCVNKTGGAKFGAADGEFIRAMRGSVTVNHRWRGANGGNPLLEAWGLALNSGLALHSPAHSTVAVTGAGAGAGEAEIAAADRAKLTVGMPIRIRKNNVDHYAQVTDMSDSGGTTTVTLHPAMAFDPDAGDVITLCYAFYPVVGTAALGNDVFAKFDMGGDGAAATVSRLAALCRCSGFSLANDNGAVSLSYTLATGAILTDDANASTVQASESAGEVMQHRYGCRTDISAALSGAAPYSAARTLAPNFDWSVTGEISVSLDSPDTRSIMGGTAQDVTNATLSVDITTTGPDATLADLLRKGQRVTAILGMGPVGDGSGGAVCIWNAGSDGPSSLGSGEGGLINQSNTLRALSGYGGTVANTALARAPWCIALPA